MKNLRVVSLLRKNLYGARVLALTCAIFVGDAFAAGETTPGNPSKSSAAEQRKNTRARSRQTMFNEETLALIEEKTESYRSNLEERAKKALNRDFLDGRYIVIVSVAPDFAALKRAAAKDGAVALSTLPTGVSRGKLEKLYIENIPAAAFKNYVKNLSVKITVDKSIRESQQKLAENLVRTALSLAPTARITVTTEDLENTRATAAVVAVKEQMNQAKEQVSQAKEQVSQAKEQASEAKELARTIKEEKERLADEIRSLKSTTMAQDLSLQQIRQENENLKAKIRSAEDLIKKKEEEMSVYQTPLGEVKKLIKGLELPLTILPLAVIGLVVVLIALAAMSSASKRRAGILKESVETISAALSKIGYKSGRSGSDMPRELSQMLEQKQAQSPPSAGANFGAGLAMSGGLAAEEALLLKRDAESAWTEIWKHSFCAKCELREWFSSGADGRARFLSLVSALNSVDANILLESFDPAELRELKDVVVDVNVKIMGYSHILSLHRAVLAAIGTNPLLLNAENLNLIVYASDPLVAKSVQQLPAPAIASVLVFLPTNRWSRILEIAAASADINAISNIIALMTSAKQPTVAERENAIQLVEKKLEQLLADERNARASVIDDLILNLDSFGPRVKSALELAQSQNEKLAQEITSRTTTFENVLRLEADMISELIEPYDTEQLAQIMVALNNNQRNLLFRNIKGRMRSIIESDFRRMTASQSLKRKSAALGRQFMDEIVTRLKEMAEAGIVEIPRVATTATAKTTSPAANATNKDRKTA
jgi:hypothetical protein